MQDLDIRSIVYILMQKIKWILLTTVVAAALIASYTIFFIPDTYKSSFSMYVLNITALSADQNATTSGLAASQQLVQEYIVILKNDMVLDKVSTKLKTQGYDLSNRTIRSALNLSSENETAMLNVSAVTTNPKLSKAMCEAMADVAPEMLKEVMEMGTIKVMAEAQTGVKNGPSLPRNTIIGALLGFILSCAVVLIVYLMDNTVKSERELKRRLDITVLGEVPSLRPSGKGDK